MGFTEEWFSKGFLQGFQGDGRFEEDLGFWFRAWYRSAEVGPGWGWVFRQVRTKKDVSISLL